MLENMPQIIKDNPQVLPVITGALVFFAAYNLGKAIRLHAMAYAVMGELQQAASENLGG